MPAQPTGCWLLLGVWRERGGARGKVQLRWTQMPKSSVGDTAKPDVDKEASLIESVHNQQRCFATRDSSTNGSKSPPQQQQNSTEALPSSSIYLLLLYREARLTVPYAPRP